MILSKKIKIGVLYGGISSEREVSINTGKQIIKNLNRDKYEVFDIILNNKEDIFKCRGLDFVYIALHGNFGEDGRPQSILDSMGIKYNGCDFLSSSMCINKFAVKSILSNFGINMAKGFIVSKKNNFYNFDLNFPVIIKPNLGGSSIGTFICKNNDEFFRDLEIAFSYDKNVLVEEFISGQEVTCGILNGQALPVFRIVVKGKEFFNYECKYDNSSIEEPANLPKELEEKIKDISLKCFNILSCDVYSRVDFIINGDSIYFLEINTLPGMTEGSLFPKMAKSVGINFTDLLDMIIEASVKK